MHLETTLAAATIVERAQLTPGKCFLSGDFNGPFVDTGESFRGYGRIYLSVKHLGPLMREAGWVPKDEVEFELTEAEALASDVSELREKAELADALLEAVAPLVPAPEPIEVQVPVADRTILRERNRLLEAVDHLEAMLAQRDEKIAVMAAAATSTEAPPTPEAEGSGPGAEEAVTIEVAGQSVNLDDLLDRPAKDVVAVAEGWPLEALRDLSDRETERAAAAKKEPRVTVLRLEDEAQAAQEDEEA